jgi:carbonic anhydrase
VVDGIELGSIEYGVHHLHTPVLVVLGHQSCGAVTAAVEGGAEGNIGIIMEEINPAVETARKTNKTGEELVEEAVDENMRLVIENILAKSPVTKELVDNGELTIVGAKYFFDTGEVKVVEERAAASTAEVADNDEEAVHETATPEDATPEDATATQDTPGFGAFAALSALGALAAILYRKRG